MALIDKGAEINAVNHAARSALMNAASWGHERTVQILLDEGADHTLRDARLSAYLDLDADGADAGALAPLSRLLARRLPALPRSLWPLLQWLLPLFELRVERVAVSATLMLGGERQRRYRVELEPLHLRAHAVGRKTAAASRSLGLRCTLGPALLPSHCRRLRLKRNEPFRLIFSL